MCSAESCSVPDLITFEIHYADRVGENYFAKHNEQQRWYYYPAMKKNEVLLMTQWDSDGDFAKQNATANTQTAAKSEGGEGPSRPTFCLHSAFDDPSSPENPQDRESIEVRCIALFD